jgi:hypothetical protein
MGSVEESRRIIEALTEEKDHYKEFWQAMNNYHSVMSRFQVQAPTVTGSPFPSQLAYSSSVAPIPQVNAPQYPASGYPLYSGNTINPTYLDFQSQQGGYPHSQPTQPPQPPAIAAPAIPDVGSQPESSLLHLTPQPAAKISQSPETPSKRDSTKGIDSYFTPMKKKTASGQTTADSAGGSRPVNTDTSPSHGKGQDTSHASEVPASQSLPPGQSQENLLTPPRQERCDSPPTDRVSGEEAEHKDGDWAMPNGYDQ